MSNLEKKGEIMKTYERMKKYILDNHLKQRSIAKDMGMIPSTFSMMLNGKRHVTVDDLEKFCKSVKAPPELFISYKPKSEKPDFIIEYGDESEV